MNATHRVPTRAIQEAVKSREEEILDALSIDWLAGHPRIICPYPSHDGSSPSWRWDDTKIRVAALTADRRSYIPGVQDA